MSGLAWGVFAGFQLVHVAMAVLLLKRRNSEDGKASTGERNLVLFLLLPLVWAAVLPMVAHRGEAADGIRLPDRSTDFLKALLVVLLPQVLIQGTTAYLAHRKGRSLGLMFPLALAQIRRRKERVKVACAAAGKVLAVSSMLVVLLYALFLPSLGYLIPVAIVLIGAWTAVATCREHASVMDESERLEMPAEYSSLQEEVLTLARSFGWAPKSVMSFRVVNRTPNSKGRDGDDEQLRLGLDRYRTMFDPQRPLVPMELLASTPPEAITAGLSMRYANATLLNPLRLLGFRRLPFWVLGIAAVMLLIVIIAGISMVVQQLGIEPAEAIAIVTLLAAFFTLLIGCLSALRRRRNFHRTAYKRWKDAGKIPESRTPEAFMVALTAYDCGMKPSHTHADVVSRLQGDKRLSGFLASAGRGPHRRSST